MSRSTRSHMPGAVFHLTARTQGQEPWFTKGLRGRIVDFAAEAVQASDAALLAYAVMPNHLHLMILQGDWKLERIMQPLLRRTALLVQRRHGIEGHVFERRFRDQPCLEMEHIRNSIAYVNLNPLRAGIVDSPGAYRWTSHLPYLGGRVLGPMGSTLAVEMGLTLFGPPGTVRLGERRRAYEEFVAWRIRQDRIAGDPASPDPDPTRPPLPRTWAGSSGPAHFGWPARARKTRDDLGSSASELQAIAREIAEEHEVDLRRIRSSCKDRPAARARAAFVLRARALGHATGGIARYLNVTPQCVSTIVARARRSAGGVPATRPTRPGTSDA